MATTTTTVRRYNVPTIPTVLIQIINVVTGLIVIVIALRIVLKFFGANAGSPFVSWLYATTDSLLWPFFGIFPAPIIQDGIVVEFSAIFGLLMYLVLAYLLGELIRYVDYWAHARV